MERTGGQRVPPELTLDRAIGTGGERGAVGEADLMRALPQGGPGDQAVSDYLRGLAMERVVSRGALSPDQAETFLRQNETLMRRRPGVLRGVENAIAAQRAAQAAEGRQATVEGALTPRGSAIVRVADADVGQEVTALLKAQNPGRAARTVRNALERNPRALAGFRTGFVDNLLNSARTEAPDGPLFNGAAIKARLTEGPNAAVARELLTGPQLQRLNGIADEFVALQRARTGRSESPALRDEEGILNTAMRIIGAQVGSNIAAGPGMGGTLQGASIVSQRFRDLASRLTNDQAIALVERAVVDDQLFGDLMRRASTPAEADRIAARLNAYAIAAGIIEDDNGQE